MSEDEATAAAPIRYGREVRLSPLVRRITQQNPGPFTGPGTNTYVVGASVLVVIDPGERRDDGHLDRIMDAVRGAPVAAILVSHGHDDHWTLAPALARRVGAPVRYLGSHAGLQNDEPLADGDVIALRDTRLQALHTPGHTRDHLSFVLEEEGALFPGDHVMGWSTSVIAPPEGDLVEYLRSLDRLIGIPGLTIAYPAHGEAIVRPYERMRELEAHREQRTRQVLDALADGPGRIGALVQRVYADTDPKLHGAAAWSLLAHLVALEEAGVVERTEPASALDDPGTLWRLRPTRGEPGDGSRHTTGT